MHITLSKNFLPHSPISLKSTLGLLLILSASLLYGAQTSLALDSSSKSFAKPLKKGAILKTAQSDSPILGDTTQASKNKESDSVQYQADEIDYLVNEKILYLKGNAHVQYQNMTLIADTITYTIDNDQFTAVGSPQLIEGSDTTVGEFMVYNINTKRGVLKYSTTRMDDAYLNAAAIIKSPDNNFYCVDGDYTTCAYPNDPHYYFYAKDIKVLPSDKAIARPAVFNIGGVPIATVPFFILPLDRKRTSGWLTPSFGGQPQAGGYLENIGYYWAINDYLDFRVSSRIAEFKDYMMSASSNYALRYWLSGSISARYSFAGDFSRQTQLYALDYNHTQTLLPDRSFMLSGRGTLVSSQQFYLKNSDRSEDLLNQQVSANMSLSKRLDKINSSISATANRTHNLTTNDITDDLPSISFSLPSRPLYSRQSNRDQSVDPDTGEPAWYEKVYYNYNVNGIVRHIKRPKALAINEVEWTHAGMQQNASLSYNAKLFKYISISPNINIRMYGVDAYKDTLASNFLIANDTLIDTLAQSAISDTGLKQYSIRDTFTQINRNGFIDTFFVVANNDSIKKDSTKIYASHNSGAADATWNGGFSMATTLYGIWPVHILNFVGLRHTLSPSINYTFTPMSTANLDKRFFDVGISTFGQLKQSQVVSFSLNNSFDGKMLTKGDSIKPVESKFHILDASAGISCDVEKGRKGFSDLSLSGSTANQFLAISVSSAFWVYADKTNEVFDIPGLNYYSVNLNPQINMNATGNLWDGDLLTYSGFKGESDPLRYAKAGKQTWQLSLRPSYSFSQSRTSRTAPFITTQNYQLSTSANISFARNWTASWNSYYNFTTNQLVGHSIDFYCDLECWDLRFNWRPSGFNPGYNFLVNIKKIPEIKWERKP